MTSICYQTTIDHNIIQFPKNPVIQKNNNITSPNMATNYDVYPAMDRFDPNMSSSPPNAFVSILKHRMDVYYSSQQNMGANNVAIIGSMARNRALSWEHR